MYAPNTPQPEYRILSLSGGKDSTALGLEWLKRHQQDPVTYPLHEVIYCDTGMEFPAMVEHINRLEQIFTGAGIKFTRLKSEKSFEYLMFEYQPKRSNPALKDKSGWSWPGPKARWCTELLKTRVINKYLDDLRNQYSMVQLIGLAADEQARLNREHNQNPEHRHPLVEWSWTEADCLKYCYDAGFDWGGLYDIFNRVSCWCCPLQSLDELRKLRKHFPDLWARLLDMEHHTWRTFRADYSVDQLEIRFDFEEERLAAGLPINRTREFMSELRKRLEEVGFPQKKKQIGGYKREHLCRAFEVRNGTGRFEAIGPFRTGRDFQGRDQSVSFREEHPWPGANQGAGRCYRRDL